MPTPDVLREITRATRPHGVATRNELRLSRGQIRTCCDGGALERRFSGVYVNPAVPHSPHQDLAAAVAAGGRGAAAWARSSAALWDTVEEFPPTPEIVVPYRRVAKVPGIVVHRSTDLCSAHVMRYQGIPTVKPLVTVLDLGVVLDPESVAEAIVRGTFKKLFTLDGVITTLEALAKSGRTGIRTTRAAVDMLKELGRPIDSVLEFRFARMANRYELPAMTFQHMICLRGHTYYIDFAYPEAMIAIEVDGYGKTADPAAVAEALKRQNALVLAGWIILRFDWSRVVNRPHEVAAEILAALGSLRRNFRA